MKLEIEQKDAQDILNYLTKRPYEEVFALIAKLVSLKKIEEEKAE